MIENRPAVGERERSAGVVEDQGVLLFRLVIVIVMMMVMMMMILVRWYDQGVHLNEGVGEGELHWALQIGLSVRDVANNGCAQSLPTLLR